jgi:hypothetical protein
MTLRDVSLPSSLFYHIAGKSLVEFPNDVEPWEPHGEIAKFDKKPKASAEERLWSIVEFSPDIGRAIDIALDSYGKYGLESVQSMIRKRWRLRTEFKENLT